MAVLFGHLRTDPATAEHLPSENEMGQNDRIKVELTRLGCLLAAIAKAPLSPTLPDVKPLLDVAPPKQDKSALNEALAAFNVNLMAALACIGRDVQLGYQLGRSLRDTAQPPAECDLTAAIVLRQFERRRITTLQSWFRSLTPSLPADSAVVVSGSLGKWAAFATAAMRVPRQGQPESADVKVLGEYLLYQGDVWINLLTGNQSTDGLLTPEGYVLAAEAAISRAARLIWRVIRHYWPTILVLAAALAAVLVISAVYLPGGAGRTWTQMVSIVGSLGVTARGIGSTLAKLTREGAKPVYAIEAEDVKAWAVTSLPDISVGPVRTSALRRAGVGRSRPLGRM